MKLLGGSEKDSEYIRRHGPNIIGIRTRGARVLERRHFLKRPGPSLRFSSCLHPARKGEGERRTEFSLASSQRQVLLCCRARPWKNPSDRIVKCRVILVCLVRRGVCSSRFDNPHVSPSGYRLSAELSWRACFWTHILRFKARRTHSRISFLTRPMLRCSSLSLSLSLSLSFLLYEAPTGETALFFFVNPRLSGEGLHGCRS